MSTSQWTILFPHHDIDGMERGARNGRNPYEGYTRGAGLQFGNARDLCVNDPIFVQAYQLAQSRTIVDPIKLMNIYMLFRFYLPKLQPGNIVEFGSYKGGSCIFMAYLAKRFLGPAKVFGFDTFQGMPATDRTKDLHKQGEFADVDLAELRQYVASIGLDNLTYVQGRFQDTIPESRELLKPLALMHIDCDIYTAAGHCYNAAKDLMAPGGYIVLDDPLTSSCLGAFEAVEEHMIRGDGLSAEQVFPHLVFRYPKI